MIGVALDLLLIVLLVGALMLGLRLEKRLRYLRETQAGFAGAAAELNMAIARAEAGLQELRVVAGEAQEILGDRLQDARAANARLDQKMGLARGAAERLERAIELAGQTRVQLPHRTATERPAVARQSIERPAVERVAERRPEERPAAPRPDPKPETGFGPLQMLRKAAPGPRAEDDGELYLDPSMTLRPAALSRRPAEPQPDPRSRARTDDELFEPHAQTRNGARR